MCASKSRTGVKTRLHFLFFARKIKTCFGGQPHSPPGTHLVSASACGQDRLYCERSETMPLNLAGKIAIANLSEWMGSVALLHSRYGSPLSAMSFFTSRGPIWRTLGGKREVDEKKEQASFFRAGLVSLEKQDWEFWKTPLPPFFFFSFFFFLQKKKKSSLLFDKEKRTSTQSSILQGRLGVPWEVGLRSLKKPHSHTFFVSFFFLPKKKKQSKAGFCLIGKVGFLSLCTFWGTWDMWDPYSSFWDFSDTFGICLIFFEKKS